MTDAGRKDRDRSIRAIALRTLVAASWSWAMEVIYRMARYTQHERELRQPRYEQQPRRDFRRLYEQLLRLYEHLQL